MNQKRSRANKVKRIYFSRVEGAIVRNIHIVTLDPFGVNIEDPTLMSKGFFTNAGNSLHIKTKPKVIENLLLFNKNEPFDSLLVKESIRLIRLQTYIRDLEFQVKQVPGKGDSVDVFITLADVWSIVPAYRRSSSATSYGIADNNFLGLGHVIQADHEKNLLSDSYLTQFNYLVPNIGNSYISSQLDYAFTDSIDLVKSIEFQRTFFSPLTKWAGGVFLGKLLTQQTYSVDNTVRIFETPTTIMDAWGARSWQLFKGNSTDARTTNLILSARFMITRYPDGLPKEIPLDLSSKENFYFAGVGITNRKYEQDNYVFKFGKVEDVPVGRYIGFTLGLERRVDPRWYMGVKGAWGKYYPFGYLSSHLEYGTFINDTGFNQQAITGHFNYFTPLLNFGNWKLRQFIKPAMVFGINRHPTDNLTFENGIKEFEGIDSPATHMLALTLQTQSYPPWDLMGFRFGPYLVSTFGVLGNTDTGFSRSRLYSYFGLGMHVKNDYLIFNTFQVSFVYYPYLPPSAYNVFKGNAYKTDDFGFRDFEISKPGVVVYR